MYEILDGIGRFENIKNAWVIIIYLFYNGILCYYSRGHNSHQSNHGNSVVGLFHLFYPLFNRLSFIYNKWLYSSKELYGHQVSRSEISEISRRTLVMRKMTLYWRQVTIF